MLYKHNMLKIKRKLEKINKSENIQLETIYFIYRIFLVKC